jgi:hypothetical protein
MSMKNANNTIGNRSLDLPVCSAVPQPPRYRVPAHGIPKQTKRSMGDMLVKEIMDTKHGNKDKICK